MTDINYLKDDSSDKRYLQFDLGSECYAIHLLTVLEVIPIPETTPLPNSPNYYVGIMNLRGRIISIIDLRKKLNISSKKEGLEEAVVIVNLGDIAIGVIVDSINKVLNLDYSNVTEVPEIKSQINAKYVDGVYQQEGNLTILLDLAKVLNIENLRQIQSDAA